MSALGAICDKCNAPIALIYFFYMPRRWTFDLDAMESAKMANPNMRMLLLCNPHNPVCFDFEWVGFSISMMQIPPPQKNNE